ALRRAVEVLGVAGGVGVVLQGHGQAQLLPQGVDDGRVYHARDVRRPHDAPALVVEGAGRADADGRDLVAARAQLARGAGHGRDRVGDARVGRVHAHAVEDAALGDHGREDLRAAQVDSQRAQLGVPPARRATSTACAAIMTSSSVSSTSTATRLSGALASGPPAAFAAGSSSIPRKPRPSSAAARVAGSFSPTPPVNTTASRPPIAAAYAPTSLRTL